MYKRQELGINVKRVKFIGSFRDFDGHTSKKWYSLHYFLCEKWVGKISNTREQEALEWKKIGELEKLGLAKVDRDAIKAAIENNYHGLGVENLVD